VSDKKISDKEISTAAELLYKGAKMLSYGCPECKLPLFEKDGKVFCPSCGREAVILSEDKEEEMAEAVTEVKSESKSEPASLVSQFERAILKVCEMILNTDRVDDVRILSESLEKLVDAYKKMIG